MTLHAVAVPKWGLAMEEGTLTAWLVPEGALVTRGQEIAELESSKIANAIEAPATGVLRRRLASEGEVKPVGALLAVLADAGEDDVAIDAFAANFDARVECGRREVVAPTAAAEIIQVGGHTTRFRKVGAHATAGVALLLLHGFGADHRNWTLNQGALAESHDVYALDLPGHGGSSKEVGDGSLETLATRVADWLTAKSISRVHLIGHSMGAAVAASIALAYPERVHSLTAVCGAGFGGVLNRAYVQGFVAATRRRDLEPVVELLFADPARVTRPMLDELLAYKRIDGVSEALRLLGVNALGEQSLERLRNRLPEVRCPTMALFGALDRILSPPIQPLPFEIGILDSAHLPQVEAADALYARIARFVREHD